MLYTIKNDKLTVVVRDKGAELVSIKSADGCEYLWQGDEKYWSGQSPIMFPICGRLCEGKYTYDGKTYEMGNHGFARHSVFSLEYITESEITLTLCENEETLKCFPFKFTLDVTYKLKGSVLKVYFKVKNTDDRDFQFAIGAHPAFNVPLTEGLSFESYYCEFDKRCDALRLDFSPSCLCTHNDKLYTQGGTKRIDLKHNLFDNDAIFLYNVSKEISLKSDVDKRSVTLFFDGMKYLGLWHAPRTDAPYICIEPWTSLPATEGVIDDLSTKKDMILLPSGFVYNNNYSIRIE